MHRLINFILVLIPITGLVAGLSLGFTIPLFLVATLYSIKSQVKVRFSQLKLELVFFALLFLSSLWSPIPKISILSFLLVLTVSLAIYILVTNTDLLVSKLKITDKTLKTALIGAIILFYIELISGGFINTIFRKAFQTKDSYEFYLHYLDRGCTMLSLFAWVVIASLAGHKKNIQAFIVYFVVLLTLILSDSLSGGVGFTLGGVVFFATRYSFLANPRILSFLLISFVLLFLSIVALMSPHKIADEANFLPPSAKHRLFIWDYSIKKASEKPFFGWGHASSRNFEIIDNGFVEHNGQRFSLLPTHPHNNIVQILLENGIAGLAIYLAILCKYLFRWNKIFHNYKLGSLKNIRSAGFACFCNFLIVSMISFNMWQSWFLCTYLWIGLLLCYIAKRECSTGLSSL